MAQSEVLKTIMSNIDNIIRESGMQAKDLAKMLGKRHGLVTDWRAGRATPGLDTIVDICNIFNCSIYDIFPIDLFNEATKEPEAKRLLNYYVALPESEQLQLMEYAEYRYEKYMQKKNKISSTSDTEIA